MIAVDTNVLLRYFLHDDELQAAQADTVFDPAETILITDVVLVETVWTLVGRKYRLARADVVFALERLFSEPNVRFEDGQVVWRALQAYRNWRPASDAAPAKGAGFPDALIVFKALQLASDHGESLDAVYTFEPPCSLFRTPHRSRDKPTRIRIHSARHGPAPAQGCRAASVLGLAGINVEPMKYGEKNVRLRETTK